MLLSDKAKAAAKEEAAVKEKEAEEERKKKQAEREQRIIDRQRKQEEQKKKDEDGEKRKQKEGNDTNQYLMELNNTDDEKDLDMEDVDMFDLSEENTNTNLFDDGHEDNEIISSPEYKRGKSTGGGVLKGTYRYSTKETEGTRKAVTNKPTTYQFTKFVEIGMLLEADDKATECVMNLKKPDDQWSIHRQRCIYGIDSQRRTSTIHDQ
jgi:hypothetical protein